MFVDFWKWQVKKICAQMVPQPRTQALLPTPGAAARTLVHCPGIVWSRD